MYQTEAAGTPQALSGIGKAGYDEKTAPAASVSNLGARSSFRAANPKTPARGPRDFCHGLLKALSASPYPVIRFPPEPSCRHGIGD